MRSVFVLPTITIIAALFFAPVALAEDTTKCREGLSAGKKGKFNDALKLYDQCFSSGKLTPKSQPLWRYNRANIYLAKGRIKDAIRDYSEAIRLRPSYSLAYGSRGLAYELNGQQSEAMSDFKKAKELGFRGKWLEKKLGKTKN